MRVYVDQVECTGAGQCEQIAPQFFRVLDTGLATVLDAQGHPLPEGGAGIGSDVPDALHADVRDAMDVCPGACIREMKSGPRQ
ncbi:ferredoxin [Rhodococcus sp. USK10]|uniref:ferredoxin n=1 Tax=Rhodococcus sp. USK10 TaxID=2789739 RepID=UPI001C5ECF6A|nr:ferredoxin [Rhodococcus sp. USK10]